MNEREAIKDHFERIRAGNVMMKKARMFRSIWENNPKLARELDIGFRARIDPEKTPGRPVYDNWSEHFRALGVGDSFFTSASPKKTYAKCWEYSKSLGCKFSCRRHQGRIRVTRIR